MTASAEVALVTLLCILFPCTYLIAAIGALWATGKAYEMTFTGASMQHELIEETPGRFWMLRRYDENGFQDPQATWLYHLPSDEAARLARKCLPVPSQRLFFGEKGLPQSGCVLLDRQDAPNFYHVLLAGRWLEVQFTNT